MVISHAYQYVTFLKIRLLGAVVYCPEVWSFCGSSQENTHHGFFIRYWVSYVKVTKALDIYNVNIRNIFLNVMFFWKTFRLYEQFTLCKLVVVVILFPEEYNRTHSICTAFLKSIYKFIPLAAARVAEAHRADNSYFNNDTAEGI